MTEKQLNCIIFLHQTLNRQGPGSDSETLKAIELCGLGEAKDLKVLDLGCGTGAQTKVLAENLHATVYAMDLFEQFINELKKRLPLPNIKPLVGSMDNLPFDYGTFDLIWSEGAIYNMGFKNGMNYLRPFLKVDGIIAVSEITWLTEERPKDIEDYWNAEYPEIGTASEKIAVIRDCGYKLIDYFILSEDSWTTNYYAPLELRLKNLEKESPLTEELGEVINSYKQEIELYRKYKTYFGYGFYVAQKVS
jgi:SAM-dependent methyltransferase